MSDVLSFLARRRSIPARRLVAPAPDSGQIRTLIEVASRVPDHGKLAPWRFIVVAGAARQQLGERLWALRAPDFAEADEATRTEQRQRLFDAPLLIAVVSRAAEHPKIPVWEQQLSAGAVCLNLVTAAHAMGFAANWLTGWTATDPRALDVLGVSEDEQVAGIIHIGTPDMDPVERPRPDLADIMTEWQG